MPLDVAQTPTGQQYVSHDPGAQDPNSNGGSGTPGTFTATVRGEPAGTTVGRLRSTVNGPQTIVVLSHPQLHVDEGGSAMLRLQMDVPWNLIPGALSCYSVTLRHLESGREYVSRGMLRGCQRGMPELRR